MTTRNLHHLFQPRAVALIGASARLGSVGDVLRRNLLGGEAVRTMLVNPGRAEIDGEPCYPRIADLPAAPDLGIVATPPDTVPGVIADLAACGAKAAVVITAGFAEGNKSHGLALQQAMLDAARPHLLRIVGPNCLGIMHPSSGLNASFARGMPRPGPLAFVAQSGAVIAAVVDWAAARGLGFSHVAALGDMADVDFGDMLDYLAQDTATRAILLYVEMVTNPRKFMSAARAAARTKPVIVVKAGRHAEGAKAAASHTGALAGADLVYDAAFRRAGMLRVFELAELFAAAETLSHAPSIRGDRLAIVTNGGGMGVMATDRLIEEGGRLAALAPDTVRALDGALPPTWSHGNPIDIIGDADGRRYAAALQAIAGDPGIDAVLVLNCPTAIASSDEAAEAVVGFAAREARKLPVLTSWVGGASVGAARQRLAAHGLPSYDTPEDAVRAFMHLVRYRRNQANLLQVPPSLPDDFRPSFDAVRDIVAKALADERAWLTQTEALAVLSAYGIPAVPTRTAPSPEAVAAAADGLPAPYALKILSRDIVHKSDVGGVALGLKSAAEAREAAAAMRARVAQAQPGARIDGFVVQPMIRRPRAHELILGLAADPQFGPVVLFGHGGTATEVLGDRALALPPLNLALAHELMGRTRVHRLLQGYRDRPAADMDGIALALVRIAQLACDHAEIVELDINPLLADEAGVLALDARIRIAPATRPAADRLAIRPYPRELEEDATTRGGIEIALRPVRPEDAGAFQAAFARLDPEDVRLRLFQNLRSLPNELASRISQIDYVREMSFVAVARADGDGTRAGDLLGLVQLAATPELDQAEYGVIVRSDMKGRGVGYLLLRKLIAYARAQGMERLYGDVLRENATMLRLCREFGFAIHSGEDPAVLHTELLL